jgi:hypothetical protein
MSTKETAKWDWFCAKHSTTNKFKDWSLASMYINELFNLPWNSSTYASFWKNITKKATYEWNKNLSSQRIYW